MKAAVDFDSRAWKPAQLAAFVEEGIRSGAIPDGGVGVYYRPADPEGGWVHYDQRTLWGYPRARWEG